MTKNKTIKIIRNIKIRGTSACYACVVSLKQDFSLYMCKRWYTLIVLLLKLVHTHLNVLLQRHFLNYLSLYMHLLPRMNVMLYFI